MEPDKPDTNDDVDLLERVQRQVRETAAASTAGLDQLEAAQKNTEAMMLVFAFTLGVVGAILVLHHRKLMELADALPA